MTLGRLFIDMDGVLADFDKGYRQAFNLPLAPHNMRVDGTPESVRWDLVRSTPGFFRNLPLMPGATQLWNFAKRQGAYILSGVQDCKGSDVALEKRRWAQAFFGPTTPVITCPSKDKCLYARPGDVLVDDWKKYKSKWEEAGGIWVTYHDMPQVIGALRNLGYDPID